MFDLKLIWQYMIEALRGIKPLEITESLESFEPDDVTEFVEKDDMNKLVIERTYHDKGTHSDVTFPDGTVLYGLENPWLNNERSVSCIPEGIYAVGKRVSPIVQRISKGKYMEGWEVQNVPNRSFILFHAGNYVRNTDGCILTGSSKDFAGGEPVVWRSAEAFDIFMAKMEECKITHVEIVEKQ